MQIDLFDKRFGCSEYKNVKVYWDEDKDERIFKFIDGLEGKHLKNLRMVQEHEANLIIIAVGDIGLKEGVEIEVDGDAWFIFDLKIVPETWLTYKDYLKSPNWTNIKSDFREFSSRHSGVCFLCYKNENLQLHHWRYPKDWKNDSYKNLMEVCNQCHETMHDIDFSELLHNSHFFNTNSDEDFIRYLSFIIKATSAMDYAYLEKLSRSF
jgi:hypothetical protein